MIKLNFQWKENKGQYQTGESLFLNRIMVGSYGWNGTRSRSEPRDDTKDYLGNTTLPQMGKFLYGQTPDEIKSKIEHKVTAWFKEVTT